MPIIKEVLVDRVKIQSKVKELAERINKDYEGKELVLIGVLKGGFIFLADLVRELTIPVDMDFIAVSSYGDSTKSSGVVRIIKDIDVDITNKHVVIVEDLVDTGLTLKYLKEMFKTKGPLSVKACTVLDKLAKRKVEIEVEYGGILIPDDFVIGYGLDYKGKYRNLPDVCTFEVRI